MVRARSGTRRSCRCNHYASSPAFPDGPSRSPDAKKPLKLHPTFGRGGTVEVGEQRVRDEHLHSEPRLCHGRSSGLRVAVEVSVASMPGAPTMFTRPVEISTAAPRLGL
jgi:hypothetical protein